MRNFARLAAGWLGFVCFVADAGPAAFPSHEDAERNFDSPAARYATGPLQKRTRALYEWPVKPLSIGNNIASYQNYGSGGYFHHGLDIRADAGTDVLACNGGKVVNIQNYMSGELYWEVAVLDDDGYLWQYHHVDSRSIPKAIRDAYKSGAKIATGAKIGAVVHWPYVMNGENYHHVHLNVIGTGKQYLNPFSFLKPLPDNSDPVIHEIFAMQNSKRVTRSRVTGPYTLAAQVSDLILHSQFHVPPHLVEYAMGGLIRRVWAFDTLPGGSSKTQHLNTLFATGTCGNYTCRKYVVDLGFKTSGNVKFPTTPGVYQILVTAKDFAGNAVSKDFEWEVY